MFSNGFPKEWSTLRKLAWLYRTVINAVSAVLKTVTGNPLHITDALAKPMQALSIALEPIQDLHGYDNPWPAGGGKNLLNIPAFDYGPKLNGVTWSIANGSELTAVGTATSNSVPYSGSHAQSYENAHCGPYPAGTYTFIALGYPFVSGGTRMTMTVFKQDGTKIKSVTFTTDNYETTITSDQPIKIGFWCTVIAGDTVDFTAKLMLTSATDTSYAPYSNICPISGWTGAKVTRTGKNLIAFDAVSSTAVGITWTANSNGSFTVNGTATAFAGKACGNVNLRKGVTYRVSGAIRDKINAYFYKSGMGIIGGTDTGSGIVYTPTENIDNVTFYLSVPSGRTIDNLTCYPMLSVGADAVDWEPYAADTYSITFPSSAGTVYGGTLDVTTGKLTVDRAMVDMGTLAWSGWEQGGSFIFNSHVPDKMPVRDSPCKSSQYPYNAAIVGSWSDLLDGQMTGQIGGDMVYVRDTRYSSIADFKTAMNGVQLVYPLATPIVYDLTPTQIEMLLGENNLWADAGDSTLTYYAEGNASTSEALGILLGGTYNNPGGADDVSDDEALGILLGGS